MIIRNHPWVGKVLWKKFPNTNHKGMLGVIQEVYIFYEHTYISYLIGEKIQSIRFNESEYEI